MASIQPSPFRQEIQDIFLKFEDYLEHFTSYNEFLLKMMRKFNKELKAWQQNQQHQQRKVHLPDVFKQKKEVINCHETAKEVLIMSTVLNSTLSDIISTSTKGESSTSAASSLPRDVVCDTNPIEEDIDPMYLADDDTPSKINPQFEFSTETPIESFLIPMLIQSGEERRKMDEEAGIIEKKKSLQNSSISVIYDELFAPIPKKQQLSLDVTGYHPSDKILSVMGATMRKYRNDPDLMEEIAELCADHNLLIADLEYHHYKVIALSLFEDDKISNSKLSTLWYFTQYFLNTSTELKNGSKFRVWPFFQKILQKYC